MRFSKACVTGALFFVTTLSFAHFSLAQAQQNDACTGPALAARDEAIGIGASIEYGDSLHEVVLYRLLTGIDVAPLKSEFWELSWGGPEGYEGRYDFDTEQPAAPFGDLLIPAAQLEADPSAYILYYRAQDMLKQTGLRSYRPERGGPENVANWWLHETADPVYRHDDFAGWLQAMAASDTFHRPYRDAGRAWYRPLISSWTYFDPKKWDVANYDDVTALALEKWQQQGKFIWSVVAFSRMRTDQPEADGLVDWFYALHGRVKDCTATRDEDVLYPLFRFHTLRLLFMRAAYNDDQSSYDKAMALMADAVSGATNPVTSDATVATRAALLMAGYSDGPQAFYPTTGEMLDGRIPQAQAWRGLRWASARSFDDYIKLAEGQEAGSSELEILNGLSSAALLRLLGGNAFTAEIRDRIAETGWLRTYLLDEDALNQRFLGYIADHHASLKDEAKVLLDISATERGKENLLFLLRHTTLSLEIDTDWNARALWCDSVGLDAYSKTLSDIMGPVLRMSEVPQRELWININYWHEYGYYDLKPSSPAFAGAAPAERRPEWLAYEDQGNEIFGVRELLRFGRLPLPRDLLIGRVLDWAKSERSSLEKVQAFFGFNGDQRVAEALHLAIVNTRNICRVEGDPNRMSRAAWIVLHANPRWRKWADKTPYWYN
jgi:hypothetical protein